MDESHSENRCTKISHCKQQKLSSPAPKKKKKIPISSFFFVFLLMVGGIGRERERLNIASQIQVLTTLEVEIRKIKRLPNQKNDYMLHYYIKLTFLSVLNFLFGPELPSSAPKARLGFFSI